MLNYLTLARVKTGIWFRQAYTPGMRAAWMVVIVNAIIIIMIKIVMMRSAHDGLAETKIVQKRYISKPARRRLAPAYARPR